ncbi:MULTISPECIES: AraC family transcriptional regulator [unclassified Streptomyces]|uniref:AraC family transcriptional regulator n=1 Tax=unclassified Streptomyces TaxID=2593676 RepID=UPI0022B61295|nr:MULTISPECIES: AraC family transcriptional regulator [unclassified Streptomyces]MCZ7415705.1 AraC family transcriptional regulator ligand-binding domain-containing protein [Streptomyces sp. WMMC897]MCZ7434484.1 AraC family transcriptional regulator ligand-binding domain-containing protein [Streptomyces sp. WMMC1477]
MAVDTFALEPALRALLADLGVSPAHVLRRAGLPGDLFNRAPVRLSAGQYFALWRALEAETDDPELPLTIGRALSPETFDPPLFAALCSPDLRTAARRIAVHKKLTAPVSLRVDESAHRLRVVYDWPGGLEPPPLLVLTELVFWAVLARTATRTRVRPLRVTTPEPPESIAPYHEFFGAAVERGPLQSVTFSARDAERPFLTADERMWDFFQPELRRRLSELEAGATTADRVRAALLEQLPAGSAAMETAARTLAVSTRTLQRQLRSEGTTFQAVLNDTREALARHYLTHSGLTVREISFLLGYEDPNSFYRAFQSWTGQTPAQAQAEAL